MVARWTRSGHRWMAVTSRAPPFRNGTPKNRATGWVGGRERASGAADAGAGASQDSRGAGIVASFKEIRVGLGIGLSSPCKDRPGFRKVRSELEIIYTCVSAWRSLPRP